MKWICVNKIKELPKNISEFKSLETLFINNDDYKIDYSQLLTVAASVKSLSTLIIYNETGGDWYISDEIGLCVNLEQLELHPGSTYYEFTVSQKIKKMINLKEFSHIKGIKNFRKIKKNLPKVCYVNYIKKNN